MIPYSQRKTPLPFCAVCGEDIRPDLVEMRKLGRGGALVRVCPGCDPKNKDVK